MRIAISKSGCRAIVEKGKQRNTETTKGKSLSQCAGQVNFLLLYAGVHHLVYVDVPVARITLA